MIVDIAGDLWYNADRQKDVLPTPRFGAGRLVILSFLVDHFKVARRASTRRIWFILI